MNWDPHPIVVWELTRACDLHCRGCPSGAVPRPGFNELTTYESYKTVDQIAALEPREFVITGGDPLERDDVYQIIDYARRRGLDPALVLTPTGELTAQVIRRLQANGLTRVVLGVDGSTSSIHESIHSVRGTFGATLQTLRWAECSGLNIEINTLLCRSNASDLEAIAALIRPFPVDRWNIHFLVPVGGSKEIEILTGEETEAAFAVIAALRAAEAFRIRIVEAPHFLRFHLARSLESQLAAPAAEWSDFLTYDAAEGEPLRSVLDSVRDGARDFLFVSHAGNVMPSEFVPLSAGNLRYRSLGAIFRGSDLFVALRDPDNLKGKCGDCEYRYICGGSRARAWAMTGDILGSDPLCSYEPGTDPGVSGRTRGNREAMA